MVETLLYSSQDLYVFPTFTDELQSSLGEVLPLKAHLLQTLGPSLRGLGPLIRKQTRMHWTRGYQGNCKRTVADISPSHGDSSAIAQAVTPSLKQTSVTSFPWNLLLSDCHCQVELEVRTTPLMSRSFGTQQVQNFLVYSHILRYACICFPGGRMKRQS